MHEACTGNFLANPVVTGGPNTTVGYTYLSVNHTYRCKNVENPWKNVKLRNKKQHVTYRTMFDSYLYEQVW